MFTAFYSLSCKLVALSQDAPSTWKYENEIDQRLFPIHKDWYKFFEDYDVKSIAPVRSTNIMDAKGGLAIETNSGKTHFCSFVLIDSLYLLNDWMHKHKTALVMKDGDISWVSKKPCPKPYWADGLQADRQEKAVKTLRDIVEHSLFNKLKRVYKDADEEAFEDIKKRYPQQMWDLAKATERVRELEKNLENKVQPVSPKRNKI